MVALLSIFQHRSVGDQPVTIAILNLNFEAILVLNLRLLFFCRILCSFNRFPAYCLSRSPEIRISSRFKLLGELSGDGELEGQGWHLSAHGALSLEPARRFDAVLAVDVLAVEAHGPDHSQHANGTLCINVAEVLLGRFMLFFFLLLRCLCCDGLLLLLVQDRVPDLRLFVLLGHADSKRHRIIVLERVSQSSIGPALRQSKSQVSLELC